jgi:hypothetical protein
MNNFPRTMVGGLSLPRLICGTNWMLGYSHTSLAKDRFIKELFDVPAKAAEVIEVFARNGCNAVMSMSNEYMSEAIKIVEQKTGQEIIWIATPGWDASKGFDDWKQTCEDAKKMGAKFCFPHQSTTDCRIDRVNITLADDLQQLLKIVREYDMIPGLSSHAPEVITCADHGGCDVETYITPYNAAGFLCQVETDWIANVIKGAKKPVMTIKPLAAGRLLPPTGLAFVWSTLREIDMVTIGTMSTYEAEESIELSMALLENRSADVKLQSTRSKKIFDN